MTGPVETFGIAEPITLFFLPDAIEALVALGQIDRAEPLISSLERRGRELDRPWALAIGARCRGLLLAANGDLAGVRRRARRRSGRARAPRHAVRAGADGLREGAGRAPGQAAGQGARALTEALEAFERMGAQLWAARGTGRADPCQRSTTARAPAS